MAGLGERLEALAGPPSRQVLPGSPSADWPAEWREPWERMSYFLREGAPPFDALEAVGPAQAHRRMTGRARS